MANCPKCGAKISPLNWKANCKQCGVDMMMYNMEERLDADEKKANEEWEKVDRITASFNRALNSFKKTLRKLFKKEED